MPIFKNPYWQFIGGRTHITHFYNLGIQLVNSRVIFKFTYPYMSTACCLCNWSSSSIGKVLCNRNFISREWSSPRYLCGSLHPGFWSERATRRNFLDYTLQLRCYLFFSLLTSFISLHWFITTGSQMTHFLFTFFCLPIMYAFERSTFYLIHYWKFAA